MRLVVAWAVLLVACAHQPVAKQGPLIFSSAEAAVDYVKTANLGQRFDLSISEEHTLNGHPDDHNLAIVVVGEAVTGRGYVMDGYEKRVGYRIYRFKRSQLDGQRP